MSFVITGISRQGDSERLLPAVNGLTGHPRGLGMVLWASGGGAWPPRSSRSLKNGHEEGEMLRVGIEAMCIRPARERVISEMWQT